MRIAKRLRLKRRCTFFSAIMFDRDALARAGWSTCSAHKGVAVPPYISRATTKFYFLEFRKFRILAGPQKLATKTGADHSVSFWSQTANANPAAGDI
jgi:hypothetical protein